MPPKKIQTKVDLIERKVIRNWFRTMCSIKSNTTIYECDLQRQELYQKYITDGCFLVCKALLEDHRPYLEEKILPDRESGIPQGKLTRLQSNLICVDLWLKDPNMCRPPLNVRSHKTFMAILTEKISRSRIIKISWSHKQHNCRICESEKYVIDILTGLTKAYDEAHGESKKQLKTRIKACNKKIAALKIHKEKYIIQRIYLQQLERDLQFDECVVYIDFNGKYEYDGNKMYDLIFSVVTYDPLEKRPKVSFYDNFSRGSQEPNDLGDTHKRGSADHFYYLQVWLRLLCLGVFDCYSTIYKSGDNGASLKNYRTFYLANIIFEQFGIVIIWHLLCPYHAYNRCDPHGGGISRRTVVQEKILGQPLGSAEAHADYVNSLIDSGELQNTERANAYIIADTYDDYYNPEDIMTKKPKGKEGKEKQGIKDICCARFDVHDITDETHRIRERGLGYVKLTSKSTLWRVLDVRPNQDVISLICKLCTLRMGRVVFNEEHNRKNYHLCPTLCVWSRIVKKRYINICKACSKIAKEPRFIDQDHKYSDSTDCPTKGGISFKPNLS
jgi:hypothetical protein